MNREGIGIGRKLAFISEAVMIEHTLFSLPFALAAMLLETQGDIPFGKLLWILLAVIAGRNGANALNRVVDRKIDARNPRTAARHLVSGLLKQKDLGFFILFCALVLLFSAYMLTPLCLLLTPVAAGMIILYSYSKRFTWLSHFILGTCVAIAPMGTLIALTGSIELRFFPIAAAVTLWVAGFDIIYACLDIEFDRKEGLHSVPARFGAHGALVISTLAHVAALVCLAAIAWFYPVGWIFYTGLVPITALITYEHLIVAPKNLTQVKRASYHINEIVSVLFLIIIVLEVYL